MSINTIDLLLRGENGSELSQAQMDNNLQVIQDKINELINARNNVMTDDNQFQFNKVHGAGLRDGSVRNEKFSELFSGVDTGSTNSIELVVNENIDAIYSGSLFFVRVTYPNTGAVTVSITNGSKSLMTGSLYKENGRELQGGDISSGSVLMFSFHNDAFYVANTFNIEDPTITVLSSHFELFGPVELPLTDSNIDQIGESYSWNHGLSGVPEVQAFIECVTPEHGYTAGDRVALSDVFVDSGTDVQSTAFTVKSGGSSVSILRHSNTMYIPDYDANATVRGAVTNINWKLIISARHQKSNSAAQYTHRPMAISAGSTRGGLTYGSSLYVWDSIHSDGFSTTHQPRILKYNLQNNNVTSLHQFSGGRTAGWSLCPSTIAWGNNGPTIAWIASRDTAGSELMYFNTSDETVQATAITVRSPSQDGIIPIEFVGTINNGEVPVPPTLYTVRKGVPVGYPVSMTGVGPLNNGQTVFVNAIPMEKYTYGAGSYTSVSNTINLIDAGTDYTGRSTFQTLCNGNPAVAGFAHNPIKKRLYLITSDRLCHIFTYSNASFDDFYTNIGTWNSNLTYNKTISITGSPSMSLAEAGGALYQTCRNNVTLEYDVATGEEKNFVSNYTGVEYSEGGAVIITPFVE
jgi:hypothetical protein